MKSFRSTFFLLVCLAPLLPAASSGTNSIATPQLRSASLALQNGDYVAARKLLLEARSLDPKAPNIDYQLAIVAFTEGNKDEAKKLLLNSISKQDSLADSQNLLGAILLRDGEYPEAIAQLQSAVAADSKLTEAYSNLAAAYRLNYEPLKSIGALRKAAALDEKQRPLYELQTRFALIEAGQTTEIENTLAEKWNSPEIESDWLITAAALYLRKGRIDEAVTLLEKARESMNANLFKLVLNDRAIKTYSSDPRVLRVYQGKKLNMPNDSNRIPDGSSHPRL